MSDGLTHRYLKGTVAAAEDLVNADLLRLKVSPCCGQCAMGAVRATTECTSKISTFIIIYILILCSTGSYSYFHGIYDLASKSSSQSDSQSDAFNFLTPPKRDQSPHTTESCGKRCCAFCVFHLSSR